MKHLLLALSLLFCFSTSAQIVNIPDPNFKIALLNYTPPIDTNEDGEIQVSEAEAVIYLLRLDNKGINDLTGIEAFVNLEILNCFKNNLTTLDISDNLNLISLDISENEFTQIDISQNIDLERLNCGFNNLTSLDVSSNSNLLKISCNHNGNLISLSVNQNPLLEDLFLSNTTIGNLDVSQNLNLLVLDIATTNISSIDVSQNLNLEIFHLSNLNIGNIDLTNNANLKILSADNNGLLSLDLTNNPEIGFLDISNNGLTNYDFSIFNDLKILWIGGNPMTEIDVSSNTQLCSFRAQNMPFLEYVNLRNGNNILFEGPGCSVPHSSGSISAAPGVRLDNCAYLQFVCVDDVNYAANNFDVPPFVTFIEDCSIANGDLNQITGTVTYDDENNGCDGGDAGVGGLLINTTDGTNNFATTTINTGDYNLTVAENTYTTTVLGLSPYFSLSPAQAVDTFVGFNQTEIADFCIAPATTANDLAVTLVPLNAARPGFEARYKLVYENIGTTQLSGNVELDFDGALVSFVEATPTETSVNGNTISWDYSNLNPFETRSIEVVFEVEQPPIVEAGDVLAYTATVNPVSGDAAPDDNVFELNQVAVNSFDPNDKQVLEGYQVLIENADKYLHYVVRFQNMGTASAINVRVQDALDEKLDWTTLKVLDASHAMETQLVNGTIDFIFDNINLPTAASDPEGSQGFVAFKVKPLPTIQLDDVVANAADIYFDFNAAIVTNTVFTRFVDELGVSDFETLKVIAYPNPANDILNIQAEGSISTIEIMNLLGQTLLTSKGKSNREQIDISGLSAGNYFVKVFVGDGSRVLRVVVY